MKNDVLKSLLIAKRNEQDGIVYAEFRFSPELEVFKGHFPQKPILPGIFQVEMVRCALESVTGKRFSVAEIKKAKWLHPVLPGDTVILEATSIPDSRGLSVRANMRVGIDKVAELTIILVQSRKTI